MSADQPSRRVFLKDAAFRSLLLGLSGSAVSCVNLSNSASRGQRETLAKPAPMLPPMPAILLTVNGAPGDPDEITVLWSFVVNGNPPQIGVAAADEHIAGDLIERHREFVLNVPSAAIVQPFDLVDMQSSKVGDKFALSGLTRGRASKVDAPTVEEAPIQLECRVFQQTRVPPLRRVFFAEVLATSVRSGICDVEGRLDIIAADIFGMSAGNGEFRTTGRRVGNIGMSRGRTDYWY